MNELEEKNLKTQVHLLGEITSADRMILYIISTSAKDVLSLTYPHRDSKKKDGKVEILEKDLLKIREVLNNLSEERNFEYLNSNIKENYISPKKQNVKILQLLK